MTAAIRKVGASASLALREVLRSRLFLSLAGAIVLIAFAFWRATPPAAGDAAAHNFVFYALFCTTALLSLAAITSAASAASAEFRRKTIHLVRVKPVPMASFLVGKWLGLSAAFAALLAFALLLVWLGVRNAPSFRVCSDRVAPALPDVGWQADQLVSQARASGVSDEAQLRRIRKDALARLPFATATLSPGETWAFSFPLRRPLDASRPLLLQVAFASDSYSSRPLSVVGAFSPAPHEQVNDGSAQDAPSIPFAITNISARLISIPLDPAPLAGARFLSLNLRHGGPDGAMPVMLQPRQSIAVLVPAGPAPVNFARAFLVMLPILALLLALGLAAGTLFTLPVAVFFSCGLILSVFVAEFAIGDPDFSDFADAHDHGAPAQAEPRGAPVARAARAVSQTLSAATVKSLHFIADTAVAPAPIAALADAERIPSRDIGNSLLWNGAALPLALLVAAGVALRRKELP